MTQRNASTAGALTDAIDSILPQTQCTRCGYPACRPYAQAIAAGEADINQCPPGGQAGIVKLAALLGRQPMPLNPANGVEGPLKLAFIDEAACIGCTLCMLACPVDAIVGASKQMHTVIADLCTGCDLCIAPCPVDCIAMIPAPAGLADWSDEQANHARQRYDARRARLAREDALQNARTRTTAGDDAATQARQARQALIGAAMERANAMHAGTAPRSAVNPPGEIGERPRSTDSPRSTGANPDGDDKA